MLYLAPDPAPLVGLGRSVAAAFPADPPSEGRFSEPVPQLTVAHDQSVDQVREGEQAVRTQQPVLQRVDTLSL